MLAKLIHQQCSWNNDTKLLDFGCGHHGNIATSLCQYTQQTVAVDVNAEAVNAFNKWCGLQGLRAEEVCALTTSEFEQCQQYLRFFHIVAASLVFHHIEPTERLQMVTMLRQRLRLGGVLVVLDVLKSDETTHVINGFTQGELRKLLVAAGFMQVEVSLGPRITLHSQKRTRLVIATGISESKNSGVLANSELERRK